ncbi:hypothetical protein RFI_25784, partial [Reticulomyxa filosa]
LKKKNEKLKIRKRYKLIKLIKEKLKLKFEKIEKEGNLKNENDSDDENETKTMMAIRSMIYDYGSGDLSGILGRIMIKQLIIIQRLLIIFWKMNILKVLMIFINGSMTCILICNDRKIKNLPQEFSMNESSEFLSLEHICQLHLKKKKQ